MKSAARGITATCLSMLVLSIAPFTMAETMREAVLRKAAIKNGLRPVENTWPQIASEKAAVGRLLFESKLLSLTRNVSCRSCHLDEFGSADGMPLARGAGGIGKGKERLKSQASILPRNTLPLWGRGGIGFNVFFWDGKVDARAGVVLSQFGNKAPSKDPLVVAIHLPPVVFREMIEENEKTEWLRQESLSVTNHIYLQITQRIRKVPKLSAPLAKAFGIKVEEIRFIHIAKAISAFIRSEFRLRETRFHRFVFKKGSLTKQELAGGLLFYGRGRCVHCHNGPYFSDFKFHVIPFTQLGFGFNGFGIDYGRYNFTQDPNDLYAFRTPPLYNVTKTAPYTHSGAIASLADTIRAHVDPLAKVDTSKLTAHDRIELYRKIARWMQELGNAVELSEEDIENLISFLKTLDF